MRNTHARDLAAPATAVAPLLDGIGGPDDRLWPVPAWPPMRLDGPLGVGTRGRHAAIRYAVEAYQPGQLIRFRFDPAIGLEGIHEVRLEAGTPGHCRLTHLIKGRARGRMRLIWPLVLRWLHDALLEDLLDRAELSATGTVARPARWSPAVRLLRRAARRL